MESFNNSNSNNKRTIALGMPPLPPTSQGIEGKSSQNPDMDHLKRKRTLTSKQYDKTFRCKRISQIMQLEETVKSLAVGVERDFAMTHYWNRHHHLLQVENDELKQKLGLYSLEIESKQAEYVNLNKEKEKLKEVYVQQQQKYEELLKCSNMANTQFMGMDQLGFPSYSLM